jgi:hypothetical protein
VAALGAAELYAAYSQDPQPRFLYAAGQVESRSGDCPRAVRSYCAFLNTRPPPPLLDNAGSGIVECLKDLGMSERTP